MLLTALLAAVTGAYPMIIKASFDTLMKDQSGMLPYVLAAIIGATDAAQPPALRPDGRNQAASCCG